MLHVSKQRTWRGLSLTANYSFAKLIEQDTRLNDQDNFLETRISPFDHTHHFTVGGVYDSPFGRGKQFTFGGNVLPTNCLAVTCSTASISSDRRAYLLVRRHSFVLREPGRSKSSRATPARSVQARRPS